MKVNLELKSNTLDQTNDDRRAVFFIGKRFFIFYDQHGQKLRFTESEWKRIKQHIKRAEKHLEPLVKNSKLIYDLTHKIIRPATSNIDLTEANQQIEPIIDDIKSVAKNIQFVPEKSPEGSKPKKTPYTQTYQERIADTTQRMRKSYMTSYMNAFSKDKKVIHLLDPSEKELDFKKFNNQDFVFVSMTKEEHITGIAFDIKQKRAYYYDSKGKDIDLKERKEARALYNKMYKKLNIQGPVKSNDVNHQNGDIHCGRYLLYFYKQVAENPETFDYKVFCGNQSRSLNNIIADLLNFAPTKLVSTQQVTSGFKNRGSDCFLNAMFQTIIASGNADHFADASNLLDPANKPLQEAFAKLLEKYRQGQNPSTHAFKKLLNFNTTGHNDANEALLRLTACYKPISSNIEAYIQASKVKTALQQHDEIQHDNVYVQLVRFKYDKKRNQTFKLNKRVNVPETVTIKDHTYKLHSFITHKGPLDSNGHYTAHVKQNKDWYEYDDTVVKPAQNALDQAKDAYILHYKKVTA